MSGRRSSSDEGNPAGTSGKCGSSGQLQSARHIAGVLAKQRADQILLLPDLLLDGGDGPRGVIDQLLRLAHIEQRRGAVVNQQLRESQRILVRGQGALGNVELQILRAENEICGGNARHQ